MFIGFFYYICLLAECLLCGVAVNIFGDLDIINRGNTYVSAAMTITR